MNEIIPTPSKNITYAEFKNQINPCFVYGWKNDNEYLYIGSTKQGYKRFQHHDFIQYDLLQEGDSFDVWYCENPKHMNALERLLVVLLTPCFNVIRYKAYNNPESLAELQRIVKHMEHLRNHLGEGKIKHI